MPPRRRLLAVAAAVVFVLLLTVLPNGGAKGVQLTPFVAMVDSIRDPDGLSNLLEIPANILLFLPLGAAFAYTGALSARRAVGYGAAFSAAIELVQLAIPGRWTSIDDWILNTVGTALGFVLWRWLEGRAPRLASNSLLQGGKRRGAGAVERGGLENR